MRPHEALGGRPPLSRFAPSPRARPACLPEVSYPSGCEVRKVGNGGDIRWRGHRILVGAGLMGESVRVEDREHEVAVFFSWIEIRQVPHEELAKDHLL